LREPLDEAARKLGLALRQQRIGGDVVERDELVRIDALGAVGAVAVCAVVEEQ
jgi:hypothetical protein